MPLSLINRCHSLGSPLDYVNNRRRPEATKPHTVNWPVELSYPTCVTWTGFSGAEINGFFGDPTRLFMKPENPDFFLSTLGILLSLFSSE